MLRTVLPIAFQPFSVCLSVCLTVYKWTIDHQSTAVTILRVHTATKLYSFYCLATEAQDNEQVAEGCCAAMHARDIVLLSDVIKICPRAKLTKFSREVIRLNYIFCRPVWIYEETVFQCELSIAKPRNSLPEVTPTRVTQFLKLDWIVFFGKINQWNLTTSATMIWTQRRRRIRAVSSTLR